MEATFFAENGKQKKININSFDELKQMLCGREGRLSPVQVVYLNDNRVMAFDEEGKLKPFDVNYEATALCREHEAIFPSDFIAGDAVLFDCVEDFECLC
jgi:hypothetical protein